jgi:hypothetical protein
MTPDHIALLVQRAFANVLPMEDIPEDTVEEALVTAGGRH